MSDDVLDFSDMEKRMESTLALFKTELTGLRTGRASASLLEPIHVKAYGSMMPLSQCASISVPEPRLILVNVWDSGLVPSVDAAIREANLGLNPATEGQMIRVPLPELSEERRKDLVKIAHKYAESSRVAIRHIRRDGIDLAKKSEKDGTISKDDAHLAGEQIQKLTDRFVSEIDSMLADKEKDIMTV